MASEITTNDLPVTPDKEVYYTGCCVIWVSNGSLLIHYGKRQVTCMSCILVLTLLMGLLKHIYIHIFCAINILDYYRTLYNYITRMYNLIVIRRKTFCQAVSVNMDTVNCLWRRTSLIVYT